MTYPRQFALSLNIAFAFLFLPSSLFGQRPGLRSTLREDTGEIRCVAFSSDGKTLAAANVDRVDTSVRYWDLASGKQRGSKKSIDAYSIEFSPDGKWLASGVPSWVEVWKTAATAGTIVDKRALCLDPVVELSSDGNTLAVGDVFDPEIKLWDVAAKKKITTLKVRDGVAAMTFAPGDTTLASVSFNQAGVKLWDVATGKNTATLAKDQFILCASFSPDGKTMVAVRAESAIVSLWEVSSGKEQATLKGHKANVRCVVFSPDGKRLATGSEDGTIKLWDSATSREVATIEAHSDRINALAFSADGKTLASASKDKTVKLWDVAPGK
jgi:WD40 repeat protein